MKKPTPIMILLLTSVFLIMFSGAALADRTMELVSVDSYGNQGNGGSSTSCISANGRYVAFASEANNLVIYSSLYHDYNNYRDIFLRDRHTGETIPISVKYYYEDYPAGYVESVGDTVVGYGGYFTGSSNSDQPSISADGSYVAFISFAYDLVPGDSNGKQDVFVRDRTTTPNQTTLASVDYNGGPSNGHSFSPSISADGRYVAFNSSASDLVESNDYNGSFDVFVRDLETNQTTAVSVNPSGYTGYGGSYNPSISADGRYVAFASSAYDLVAGDTNTYTDIFVRDLEEGETIRVNINSSTGEQANGWSQSPSISADGRYVAFYSNADNLLGGGSGPDSYTGESMVPEFSSAGGMYVHDLSTGITSRVATSSGDPRFNYVGYGGNSYISGDGRYIAFNGILAYDGGQPVSFDPEQYNGNEEDFIPENGNPAQIFAFDQQDEETAMVSVNDEGTESSASCSYPAISDNGLYISFYSLGDNLVDNDYNCSIDVFISVPIPEIDTIDPASGLIYGGTEVTITGSDFVTGADVYFDGTVLDNVTVEDSSIITAVTPAHDEGFVDVTVMNPDGYSDTLEDGFEYICPVPDAPDDLAAYKNGLTDVFLSWNDNSDNEDGFVIERMVGEDGTWELYDILAPDSYTYEDNDLEQQVIYFYRVYAYNQCGDSDYSNIAVMAIGYVPVAGEYVGSNFPPIVDAGEDQTVCAGDTVSLDGSGSWDFNGEDVLTFEWSIVSAPAVSTATLTSGDTPETSFVPVAPGEYVVELTISDGDFVRSITVTITVEDCSGSATGQISADASSGGCFVATAAYGSADSPTVQRYIMLRDRYLLNSAWGRTFISLYYAHSPKYAGIISQSEALRAAVRVLISPWTLLLVMGVAAGAATAFGARRL